MSWRNMSDRHQYAYCIIKGAYYHTLYHLSCLLLLLYHLKGMHNDQQIIIILYNFTTVSVQFSSTSREMVSQCAFLDFTNAECMMHRLMSMGRYTLPWVPPLIRLREGRYILKDILSGEEQYFAEPNQHLPDRKI